MTNSIPAPNYTQVPNVIFDHWMPLLNETQFKCLLFICRKTFGWHKKEDSISISQFEKAVNITKRNIQRAIDHLIEVGLVIKNQEFTVKGDHAPCSFSLNIQVVVSDIEGSGASATRVGAPAPPTKTRPRSSQTFAKGNDTDKTVPFASAKDRTEEKPTNCKYPLKKSQEPMLELLRTLDLECGDDLLFILIRSHPEQVLIDSIAHLRNAIERGVKFKKGKIAFFRDTLKGNQSPVTDQCIQNRDYAMKLASKFAWNSLEIRDKYCFCSVSGMEIPNNFNAERFKERLHEAYDRFRGMC